MRQAKRQNVTYAHSIILVCATIMIIIGIVLLFASPGEAQEVTLTSVVKGAYLGPDGAVWYEKPLLQSDVLIAWEKGFYIDLWTSSAFNTKKDWDKEFDGTLGYGGKFRRVSYSLEGVYFAVMDGDIFHAKTELSLDISYVSPFVAASGFWPISKGGPKSGSLLAGGLRTAIPLGKRVKVSLEASSRHDSGAFGYDKAWLAMGNIGMEVNVTSRMKFLVGVEMSKPVTAVTDGRKEEVVWEFGFSYRFE